jgi:hypothetical protein
MQAARCRQAAIIASDALVTFAWEIGQLGGEGPAAERASVSSCTKELEKLWDALEIEIKQRGLPDRTIFALADAAMGLRVRSSTYRAAVQDISPQVASRDLKLLVERKLLQPKGERRGRAYMGSPAIKAIRERTREPKTIQDPFTPRQTLLSFD